MSAVVSSVSGLSMLVLLLFCTDLVRGRLLLSSWSDLYSEDGGVDTERLAREADLLTVTSEPDPSCPGVELEVAEYEVVVEGKEELVHIKTRRVTLLRTSLLECVVFPIFGLGVLQQILDIIAPFVEL